MTFYKTTPVLYCLFAILLAFSCSNEDEMPEEMPLEDLNITTITFSLMESGTNSDTIRLSYEDLDGSGGNAPMVEGGTLKANTLYFGELEFWDESTTPTQNLTEEIAANKSDYQVFFITNGLNLDFIYADADADGFPVGLLTAITTADPASGDLLVVLQGSPNKAGTGVSTGLLDNAGGRRQIQANFPVGIQ